MKIAELYRSQQGEGFLTGTPSTFVRASGCNLRCWFCDTPYTSWSPEGDELSVEEILGQVLGLDCKHVVVTGGEPMLQPDLVSLTAELHAAGCHITIETAGTRYLDVTCDLISISPKLSGSAPLEHDAGQWRERHERARHRPDVVRRLVSQFDYQVKFVIDVPSDCQEVEQYLDECPEIDRSRVLLMPQGADRRTLAQRARWLEPYCRDRQLEYCPRRHIELFGLVRGT